MVAELGRRRGAATGALASVAFVLCACNGAEWDDVRVASPYSRPASGVNLTVTSVGGDEAEAMMQTLTASLVEDLADDGIEAIVDLESPTSDQLKLTVAEWSPGNQAARSFVGFGAGEGDIVIVVDLKDPAKKSVFHGRIRGYVMGGFFGGSSRDSVRAAARSIAEAVRTGEAP